MTDGGGYLLSMFFCFERSLMLTPFYFIFSFVWSLAGLLSFGNCSLVSYILSSFWFIPLLGSVLFENYSILEKDGWRNKVHLFIDCGGYYRLHID